MNTYGKSEEQLQSDKKKAKSYVDRQVGMKTARNVWENHWQECMEYIVPRKNDVTSTRPDGDKRGNDLYDTTAILSNQLLASALHGMLTNPATRFFELIMGDPLLDSDEKVKAWLQEVAEKMFIVLNNSNFQTEVHEVYIDLGSIGTACLYMGEHEKNIVHFGARPMKEIYVLENNLGLIDTVHREFSWTPRQIVQEFGEQNMHPYVLKKYQEGCEDKWKIIHAVSPLEKKNPKGHAFESCYVLVEELIILHEGGFNEFPYSVPRWTKTSGETYGRGPGMDMLPDIKMVNEMMKTTLQGAQKTIHPPLMVPDDGVIGKVRLTPSGITVVRPGEQYNIKPLITDARIDFGYQAVEDVRKRIRSGFYVDQLQLNEGPQMTAAEVMQRTEEKLRLMGPVLGRQHFEFLRPLVERVFGMMVRAGKIPEPPNQIRGKSFDVRYSSLVARAQMQQEGTMLMRAINVASPIINADPKALDNLDSDKALKYVFELYGVPEKIFRDQREVQKIRDARDQANQLAAQQAQQAHQADVASKVIPGVAQLQQAQAQVKQ